MEALAPSNANYDFNAYNAAKQIWNGSAYVTEAVADFEDYRIPATKVGDANAVDVEAWFTATAPEGALTYVMRVRGATLADSYIVAGPGDAHDLNESDQVLVNDGGVYKLKTYKRGTSVEVLPAKTAKQPDGSDLTDPTTQRLAGYRE